MPRYVAMHEESNEQTISLDDNFAQFPSKCALSEPLRARAHIRMLIDSLRPLRRCSPFAKRGLARLGKILLKCI